MATAAERTPPAAKARARARVHPSRRKDTGMAYIMLAPVLVLLGIFVIWPAIQAVYLSFFDWSFYTDSEFVGWKNFRNVLIDDKDRKSTRLNSSHVAISYAVFCLKKKKKKELILRNRQHI